MVSSGQITQSTVIEQTREKEPEDMEYRNFGTGGVKVSPIALGLGFRGQADAAAAERTIRAAIENGINLIDCANVYGLTDSREFAGTSEQVLSKVLKDHRDDLVVTSKVFSPIGPGPNDSGLSRFHIMREIERTLRRLDTDHIDVYLVHGYDDVVALEEQFRALDDLVTQGQDALHRCVQLPGVAGCPGGRNPGSDRRRPADHRAKPLQPAEPLAGIRDVSNAGEYRHRGHGLQPTGSWPSERRVRSGGNSTGPHVMGLHSPRLVPGGLAGKSRRSALCGKRNCE